MIGAFLLAAYAVFIFITATKKHAPTTTETFFVSGRSSSSWDVALSIVISCVGASATLGVIGKAFIVGTPAFWWLGAGAVGVSLLGVFFARVIRESRAYTLPEMVTEFLGAPARPLISLVIVIAWLAILAAQFAALERIIVSLTGFSKPACLGISFLLIGLHSTGGQAVIMRLDKAQTVLIFGGLIAVLLWLTGHNPTWAMTTRIEATNADFPIRSLLYYLFVVGGNYLICPMLSGRILSAESEQKARNGCLLAGGGLLLCSVLITSVGLASVGLLPEGIAEDAVFTSVLETVLPSWLGFVLLLTLTGAVVSSADTCLVTAATVLSHDLLRKRGLVACRICVFALGALGLGLSQLDKSILGFLLMAYDVYVCGVVVPVSIGLLAKKRWRIHPLFACAAIIGGGTCGGFAAFSGVSEYSYAGMVVAALVTCAGMHRKS